ncbi:hypothetical protein [Rheinheimera sp.]|uniref:hypothetical protein n=1 Tax=Rheinheimera sp. TaxID=1869214 RepID=UPI002FDCF060
MGRDYNKCRAAGKVTVAVAYAEKTGKNAKARIKALICDKIPQFATLRHAAELAKSTVVLPCPLHQHNQHYFCLLDCCIPN